MAIQIPLNYQLFRRLFLGKIYPTSPLRHRAKIFWIQGELRHLPARTQRTQQAMAALGTFLAMGNGVGGTT